MGFLDNIRERLGGGMRDDYYDDDGYDDYYDEDRDERSSAGSGVLGNTRRPEADSVSVYTRSGRPLGGSSAAGGYPPAGYDREDYDPAPSRGAYTDTGAGVPSSHGGYGVMQQPAPSATYTGNGALGTAGTVTPGDVGVQPVPRMSSGQLPPYVLRPAAYDDVQTVVRRAKTSQPVVLAFHNTNIEVAKRILDFSFGLSCGIGGSVEELGDRVFVVLPAGASISAADRDKLVADGVLGR